MTKKQALAILQNKITEADITIRKQENQELSKIINNAPKDIQKMFNEYKRAFRTLQKIEKKMVQIEKKMEKKEWFIAYYMQKPVLTISHDNPAMRKLVTHTSKKLDKLMELKETIAKEIIALHPKDKDMDKYLQTIDARIQKVIK